MFIKTVIRKFMLPHDCRDEDLSHLEIISKFDEDVNKAVRELKAPNNNGTFVKDTYVQSHVAGLTVTLIATINYTKRDYLTDQER
mgnify:FL=1|tara:strand:+ start:415 stop:669 length:255 start_codon:yes stop_codon:yes gene_type:complete